LHLLSFQFSIFLSLVNVYFLDFLRMMDFRTNSWYRLITAASIDSQLSMAGTSTFINDREGLVTFVTSNNDDHTQQWQIYPVDSSIFMLRTRASGPSAYLAIRNQNGTQAQPSPRIYGHNETDNSMLWGIAPWGDGTFYFRNMVNGKPWNLEFRSPDGAKMHTNITGPQPGLSFSFIKLEDINDSAFSTIRTPLASTITTELLSTSTLKPHPTSDSVFIQAFSTSTQSKTSTSTSSSSSLPTRSSASHPSLYSLSPTGALGVGVTIGVLGVIFFTALGLFFFQQWRRQQKSPESLHYRRAKLWNGFTPQHRSSKWSIDSGKSIGDVYVAEVPELPTPSVVLSSPRSERHFSWQSMITTSAPGSPFWPQTPISPPAELPV
jgi:hypothetical protein